MTSGPATREFRNEVVRITELAVVADAIEGYTFSNCEVVGPAVLLPLGGTSFTHSRFDAPDADALFWPFPLERVALMGVVAVVSCHFSACSFRRIGLAVPERDLNGLKQGFLGC